jgi:hypothetical protein
MFTSLGFFKLLSAIGFFVVYALLAAVCARSKLRSLLDRPSERDSGPPVSLDGEEHPTAANSPGSRLAVSAATCAALAACLGIPLGSLPPLLPFTWGGLAVLGCLAISLVFERDRDGATRRKARALAFLGLSLALFAWYARQRGAPGELFALGTYVTAPPALFAGWQSRLGMLLLALALLLALRDVQRDLASGFALALRLEASEARPLVVAALTGQIWVFAALGMTLCLFAPFCPAGWFGMSGFAGLAADALMFLLKLLIADHALWRAKDLFPQGYACLSRSQFLLAGLGALCMFPAH